MDPHERQQLIEKLKKQNRKNNWDYLYSHPEVRAFIRTILSEAIREKPDQIYDFAASLFACENLKDTFEKVNAQMMRLKTQKDSSWTEYDGEMFFEADPNNIQTSQRKFQSVFDVMLKFSGINKSSSSDYFPTFTKLPKTSVFIPSKDVP